MSGIQTLLASVIVRYRILSEITFLSQRVNRKPKYTRFHCYTKDISPWWDKGSFLRKLSRWSFHVWRRVIWNWYSCTHWNWYSCKYWNWCSCKYWNWYSCIHYIDHVNLFSISERKRPHDATGKGKGQFQVKWLFALRYVMFQASDYLKNIHVKYFGSFSIFMPLLNWIYF